MIVCFSCTPETKALLDGLVSTGQYADHSAVLAAAIGNLSVLHSEMKGGAAVVLHPQSVGAQIEAVTSEAAASDAAPVGRSAGSRAALLDRPKDVEKPTSLLPVTAEAFKKSVPLNQWMFGQFNRLLPAKVTCRALVNLLAQGRDNLTFEETANEIANEAAKVGAYLKSLDDKRNLGRDEQLAVAFPTLSQIKSVQRFANQFVGTKTKEGQLLGLPASLKLVALDPNNPNRLALTEAGWIFGEMDNPLLDRTPAVRSVDKFSESEIVFLLDHIRTNVPTEASAYKTVLTQILQGAVTPVSLDRALAALPGQAKNLGSAVVSTQRSGVVSRMADLGLIARSRTATRVSYVVNTSGKEFWAMMGGAE